MINFIKSKNIKAAHFLSIKLKKEGIKNYFYYKNNKLLINVQDYNKKNKKINQKLIRIYKYVLKTFKEL